MRLILALAVALSFTSGFAQVQSAGSLSGSATSGVSSGNMNSNSIQRTSPTTGGVINNTDTVGTSQSGVLRNSPNSMNSKLNNTIDNNVNTVTPTNSNGATNCIDSSGRSYGVNDSGFAACSNTARPR